MRTVVILVSLLFVTACADGRWVAHDLSRFSFQFNAPASPGPFAKTRATAAPPASVAAPARASRQPLVAATR